jgi:hypothetical protein
VLDGTGPVPYSKKAYTAKYKREDFSGVAHGRSEFVFSNDGAGHARTELLSSDGSPMIFISNYLTGKCYCLYPSSKTGMWYGLKNTGSFLQEEEWLKSKEQVTPIGEKKIGDYTCRGWRWTIATGYVDLWFGKNEGCLISGESRDFPSTKRNAWWKQDLVKYNDKPMPAEAFTTDGYKISAMP